MSTTAYYVADCILIAGVVFGIVLMRSPRTARRGNLLGGVCVLGAVAATLLRYGIVPDGVLCAAMGLGGVIGCLIGVRVAMTRMPQLVALLNGFGGGASAIVAFVLLGKADLSPVATARFAAGLALVIGSFTFSGSVVAAGKLDQRIRALPVVFRRHTLLCILALVTSGLCVLATSLVSGNMVTVLSLASALTALCLGVLLAIRVGGGDMPITISLLNSLSGVAVAVTGFAISNPLLVGIGGIIGSAGVILTRIMSRAMNRSLRDVLTGRIADGAGRKPVPVDEKTAPRRSGGPGAENGRRKTVDEARVPEILERAATVIIIPGYGMALGRAQHQVKALYDKLEGRGKQVRFAVHPVAGRMPGHMHVLLAEVRIPYGKLVDMKDINDDFEQTDLVIVVGANDVINPAARTAVGTPIYGMPILNAERAGHVIICNKDTAPGYAGVDNPLYEGRDNVTLVLGDAAETLDKLVRGMD